MAENCSHDCSTCGADCPSRDGGASLLEKPNALSRIGRVIAVVSGKGGVGKSLVTTLLAVLAARRGKRVAILDADITGPSIPKLLGISGKAGATGDGIYPLRSKTGIEVMSINLLLERTTDPVVWRGPIIAGAVKQFWTDVVWGDVDCMFIDMPPGTGDVPLTVFQSIPVDGVVVVTSPQELVSMIVEKAVSMAAMMNMDVLGLVENYSYFVCPDCSAKHEIFGASKAAGIAAEHGIANTARIPVDAGIAKLCDEGRAEAIEAKWLEALADALLAD
ncbi:MAG: Mrp/NBP35 family ATP-binding protein [Clostridia bacterium]|nr:Mrp/NBP35 family ATP-binding protein [Clostridia bacterium]